ncbi:3-phosphoshikimate 1-carboxyvinyltransferase [Limnochorda pilosa]|uniref:3-phosphoshikimate 1-carboxyvinyltransferase n=1 Tax=Limnochorda pilosa TaxID=1555112 RepID=A0A0K2SM61_LIMPI|nr:3-phosphoshikimate 1-carboxyvinyltransferase [Limnochorda pilosa]BAS28203.1 3-phosphoshikimate 1-carboxyvinyltransferase [Limnochorda pilosa]
MNPLHCIARPGTLQGEARIPGSKSNTTRAVVFATLAPGRSVIHNPVTSVDCFSTVRVCRQLGAKARIEEGTWTVDGVGTELEPPSDVLDVGNSGTTLYILTATGTLLRRGHAVISGDEQIRRRPSGPLVRALTDLGATAFCTRPDAGAAPIVVGPRLAGGRTQLPGVNSQWLTPLLMTGPLSEKGVTVDVDNLQERPYIALTLAWLDRLGIRYSREGWRTFHVPGGQAYAPFEATIPADWESACFPLVAAAITDSEVTVRGLDLNDPQGDKAIVEILQRMGADIAVQGDGGIRVRGGRTLHGTEIDCGDIPDAPPILAVLGSQAEGRTVLYNLGAARLKETDRPRSIYEELSRMGARMHWETEDRLVIERSDLHGTEIDGRHDHRIVMATAVAALVARGATKISDAQYAAISFPNFFEVMQSLGAPFELVSDATAERETA